MAPPPPTAPLFECPLGSSCALTLSPESSLSSSHGKAFEEKRTNVSHSTVPPRLKSLVQSFEQRISISSSAQTSPALSYPLPVTAHPDLDLLSASCCTSLSPFAVLPPLSWIVTPLSVAGPARPPSPFTQSTATRRAGQPALPSSIPPASHLAARHHPPLVRHLLDKSVTPPFGVRLPPCITDAVVVTEGPGVPGTERRRLSAPADAPWPCTSVCHPADGASADTCKEIQKIQKKSSVGAADFAPAVCFINPGIAAQTSCTKSHPSHSSLHVESQSGKFELKPPSARSGDKPNAPVSLHHGEKSSLSQDQRTPVAPLLQQLLIPQAGAHYPDRHGKQSNQGGQHWPHPKVLIPPFFSAPAALQRSENTLQAELSSSILRCRAAEFKQQRLLQIGAAVVHQAVRVHASNLADLIEIRAATAAAAAEGVPSLVMPGCCKLDTKPGRTLDRHAKRGPKISAAGPIDYRDESAKVHSSSYQDILWGPADPISRSSVGIALQCLPVIVALAGTDASDHRLAVHSFLQECMRRCRRKSTSIHSETGLAYVSQRGNLFLRFAVVRPADCSSLCSAMHAIYEQVTQTPSLTCSASPCDGRSWEERRSGSATLRQEAHQKTTSDGDLSQSVDTSALESEAGCTTCDVTAGFAANNHVCLGREHLSACCDGGAAAAWGESMATIQHGPCRFLLAAGDASVHACIKARQEEEVAAAAELQQLIRRELSGAEAGGQGAGVVHSQEEIWEIEKKRTGVASARTRCSKDSQSCEATRTHFSCPRSCCARDERERFQQQDVSAHQWGRSMQQQQQECRKQHFDGGTSSYFAKKTNRITRNSSRAYVRTFRKPTTVCEKLASWWAVQQQQLLQGSMGGFTGDATYAARCTKCKKHDGNSCISWSVRTRASATRVREAAAAQPSEFWDLSEDGIQAEEQEQSTDDSSGKKEEEEEGEKRQKGGDVVEIATDRETTDEDTDTLHSQAKVPSGNRKNRSTAAAGRATRFCQCQEDISANSMQPAAVLIVLEEAEAFPGGFLVKLLQLLALLRRQLCIPFIVVATASTSVTVLQELCDIPLSSNCSLTIEPATLLQPARVQQQLLQLLLCCPAALPFALPLAAAERLLQTVEESSSSVLQLLRRLQLLLRVFYQHHPLAFLCRGLDGVAELMVSEEEEDVLGATKKASPQRPLPHSNSSSSNTAVKAGGAPGSGTTSEAEEALACSTEEEVEDAGAEQKKASERGSSDSSTTQGLTFLQKSTFDGNSGPLSQQVRACASAQVSVTMAKPRGLQDSPRPMHATRVLKQLRRRVELLSLSSLTEDHVNLLRQLLRHTNEVYIHLTAAQHEGLLFFDRCCWQQIQLQRQQQRRTLLAAAAAASNGAVPAGTCNLLPPLQGNAAASTLALRCRPEEDDEVQKQKLTTVRAVASEGGSSLSEDFGQVTCTSTESDIQRKIHPGCRRLGSCVASRSAVALLRRWWGSRGLLLLQKLEEEEKQRKRQQQQEQRQSEDAPSVGRAAGRCSDTRQTRGARDTQETLVSLKLQLLSQEVLPVASVELLQRRVGSCMAYRLLFVLEQQLQRCRRLSSGAAADMWIAGTPGKRGGGSAAEMTSLSNHSNSSSSNWHREKQAIAQEDVLLLQIAAEEGAYSNCRQTIETLDMLIGAHEESSCLLRKCKPYARAQEMAKACVAVGQDVRRIVTSLFQQFAVAAPARLSPAAAATHRHDVLADPAALMMPLKLFRAQVKREAHLLRLLAAAEETQHQHDHRPLKGNKSIATGAVHAVVGGTISELFQQQPAILLESSTHSSEVVRILDALDVLIRDLEKAAHVAAATATDACAVAGAAVDVSSCHVERSVSSGFYTPGQKVFSCSAASMQQEKATAQDNMIHNTKQQLLGPGVVAKRPVTLARCSSEGITLHNNCTAAAQRNKYVTNFDVETLRVLLSLKRRFLRWVEEALLLLLLPLPGWHPLGGELAVWGGALGFEIAAAVQAPAASAAASCPSQSHSSAAGIIAQQRHTAGTSGGRLAAAADRVCSSFEAAPQTETLHHAAMSSTSFLQRFNVAFSEDEEDEAEEASQTHQQRHQAQHHLEQPLQAVQKTAAEMGSALGGLVEREKADVSWADRARRREEVVKLEDVAILMRLVHGAGRRINMWDLFCAFCRDLLRDRFKKRKSEREKRVQTERYTTRTEEHHCTKLQSTGSSSSPHSSSSGSSSPHDNRESSTPNKVSSQRRKRHCTGMSESDVEEEVLRLMEKESFSPQADWTFCDKGKSPHGSHNSVTRASQSSNSHDTAHVMCTELTHQQNVASSRVTHAHGLYNNCASRNSNCSAETPRASTSRLAGASASLAPVASIAAKPLPIGANPFRVPDTMDDCVPSSLLEQLQLRFAVAVETLDHQLGVIRLPSTASTAAAVERMMLAEDGVEDGALNSNFALVPLPEEHINGADEIFSEKKIEDNDSDCEGMSDDDEDRKSEESFFAAQGDGESGDGKQKSLDSCKVEDRQPLDDNAEKSERRNYRTMRTRSCGRDLAGCEHRSRVASLYEGQEEDADEKNSLRNVGGYTLTQEIRNMRKLLRNVFARRTHFVSVYIEPTAESPTEKEHDDDKVRGQEDRNRSTCEETEKTTLRTKGCNRRRKFHRRSKKKELL